MHIYIYMKDISWHGNYGSKGGKRMKKGKYLTLINKKEENTNP